VNKALTFLVATCCVLLGGVAARSQQRPRVVIFLTDDQGTLDANCYGSRDLYTPTIDELAATGVRFTQAYSHTVCCPARALLLTGRHPQRSSVNHWTQGDAKAEKGINMFREEVTIAEMLKAAGYRTALFGKWHLGAHLDHGPTEQGFDEFFGIRGGFIDNYRHYFLHGMGYHDLYEGKKEVFADGEYFPDLMIDRAVDFIDRGGDKPFFMYVALNIPHYPEQADSKFEKRYQHLPMPRRSYAQMISTTDDRIGRVIAALQDANLRENTIIVFQSDNGHSTEDGSAIRFDNHTSGFPKGHYYSAHGGGGNTGKWRGAKGSFHEGGLRVPAIISYPKKLPRGPSAIRRSRWPTGCPPSPNCAMSLCRKQHSTAKACCQSSRRPTSLPITRLCTGSGTRNGRFARGPGNSSARRTRSSGSVVSMTTNPRPRTISTSNRNAPIGCTPCTTRGSKK
jgi:arylsulfatase A-like enzyme